MNNLITTENFYNKYKEPKKNIKFEKFSPSGYLKFKDCPKKWYLENLEYDKFENNKYPSIIFLQSLIGTSIHKTIEKLIYIMKDYECNKINDQNWQKVKDKIITLKELFKNVVQDQISKCLDNPRNKRTKEDYEIYIDNNIQNIMFKVKKMVSKINLTNSKINLNKRTNNLDFELINANLTEFKIESNELNLFGFIDFLKIKDEVVEIYDFKTGLEKEKDQEQILLYSLIWKFDEVHNSRSRNASKLTLIYNNTDTNITPLNDLELQSKANSLKNEIKNLKNDIKNDTFEARPKFDNCNFCSVKQLCNDYWNYLDQNKIDLSIITDNYKNSDIEIDEISKDGDRWNAKVSFSNIFIKNQNVVIENRGEYSLNRDILNNAKCVRILNFDYYPNIDEEPKENRIVLNKFSEVFKIN